MKTRRVIDACSIRTLIVEPRELEAAPVRRQLLSLPDAIGIASEPVEERGLFGVAAMRGQGHSAVVRPLARYPAAPAERVVVLEHGRNPSTDIYLRPRLSLTGAPPVQYVDIAKRSPELVDLRVAGGGALFVIVCRYVTGDWLRRLEAASDGLTGLAYFMDDDLPAAASDFGLPAGYRRKIHHLYSRHVGGLSALADRFWVSSHSLAAKYADHGAALVEPVFVPGPGGQAPCGGADADGPFLYFYHGSSAHRRELRWLVDVVTEVQRRHADAIFEVIGNWRTRRLFRGVERVRVIPPMSWPDYLAYGTRPRPGVGLAPLLPSPFNAARSPSKFFDIARSGSVGLYSDAQPYSGFVRDGVDGILLANEPQRWAGTILALAADAERRATLAMAAHVRSLETAARISPLPFPVGPPQSAMTAAPGGGRAA